MNICLVLLIETLKILEYMRIFTEIQNNLKTNEELVCTPTET